MGTGLRGFRNAYALAFAGGGELFTFDSDTEFELNLPWYRPTRVLHAVSGADFGWRRGALKIPDAAPDIWPSVLPMGLGSPTAVLAARDAKFPAAYHDAMWVADWSYGKIFALTLQPKGATFSATRQEIVSGLPLPVTAMCVNPIDGAIYFTTGGRRLQSALYRLRWSKETDRPNAAEVSLSNDATTARKALEVFHGREDSGAVDAAWPLLESTDPFIRNAARTALESQPVATWRERALGASSTRTSLAALLALARVDARGNLPALLGRLRALHAEKLTEDLRVEWLRVLALTWIRAGEGAEPIRREWSPLLSALCPSGNHQVDAAAIELLVFCAAPDAAARGVAALQTAVTREAQLDFAKSLRVLRTGWTPALRRAFFEWLADTQAWRGGGTFARFLQKLRDDSLASVPESERPQWRAFLAAAAAKNAKPAEALLARRTVVRDWSTDDLVTLAHGDTRKRDVAAGRKLFAATGCFACHTFGGEGGALGPDLTAVAHRLSVHDMVEAIVEPSREISDQYGTVQVKLRDGRALSGRIVNLTETGPHLAQDLADPSNVVRLAEADVVSIEPSKHSLMPPGLLNVLSGDEVLDLLAFLQSGAP